MQKLNIIFSWFSFFSKVKIFKVKKNNISCVFAWFDDISRFFS
jgi:hypothetical protein